MIQLRVLRWEDYSGLSWGLNVVTRPFSKTEGGRSVREKCDHGSTGRRDMKP